MSKYMKKINDYHFNLWFEEMAKAPMPDGVNIAKVWVVKLDLDRSGTENKKAFLSEKEATRYSNENTCCFVEGPFIGLLTGGHAYLVNAKVEM